MFESCHWLLEFFKRELLELELVMVSRVAKLVPPACSLFVADRLYIVYRRSPLGSVHPSVRALSGRLKFTVRRHKFNQDSLSWEAPVEAVPCLHTFRMTKGYFHMQAQDRTKSCLS
jgi:hypothetical protein